MDDSGISRPQFSALIFMGDGGYSPIPAAHDALYSQNLSNSSFNRQAR
jgi:hypothetical protein